MSKPATATKRTRPLYLEVSDTLLGEIADDQHPVGAMLPTEFALCKRFRVSRYTVREALRRLDDMGVVKRRQGSGTVVRARVPTVRYAQRANTVSELLQYPKETRLHVVGARNLMSDDSLSEILDCPPDVPWHCISGIRRDDSGTAFCWSDIYVAPEHAGVSSVIGSEPLMVHDLMEQMFDLQLERVTIELSVSRMSAEHAADMGVEPGTPALVIVRRYYAKDGACFEISVSEHPEGRFAYSLELEKQA